MPATLIIRPEKLGDLVVATPAFRALKESFPNHELHLLTDSINAEVVKFDPHLDKIITFPWSGRQRSQRPSLFEMRARLKSARYDSAAILYSGWEGWNWICASLKIPEVAQLGGTKSGMLFRHQMVLRGNHFTERHMRDWYLDVAGKLGAATRFIEPKIYLHEAEVVGFKKRFPDYVEAAAGGILLHLGGSPAGENVSIPKFAEWVPVIESETGRPVYITGTDQERRIWKACSPRAGDPSLLAKLSIRELMVALHLAGRVVCNSTGVIHLSAALGTPTLGLYTPDPMNSVRVWGALGENTQCITPELEDLLMLKSQMSLEQRVDLGEIISLDCVISAIRDMRRLNDLRHLHDKTKKRLL